MNVKILIATHKSYRMLDDDIYKPIHVGKAEKQLDLGFFADNTGDNISSKNANYCELTALYWAWKNLQADYIGLSHYRRHFAFGGNGDKWGKVLTGINAKNILKNNPIVVPNKRRYYIETNYSHYIHAHRREGIDLAIEIIKRDYPNYSTSVDKIMNRTWAHMFNMFIMRKDYFDKYCEWLFDVLFKVEERLDLSGWTVSEARVFGYVAELLLDVWLDTNRLPYKEVSVMFMEKQNWIVKGGKFIIRKFVKYA